MKKSLVFKSFLILLSLIPTSAFAHAGHLANDSVHGIFHVEHIIVITAIAFIAYLLSVSRKK